MALHVSCRIAGNFTSLLGTLLPFSSFSLYLLKYKKGPLGPRLGQDSQHVLKQHLLRDHLHIVTKQSLYTWH